MRSWKIAVLVALVAMLGLVRLTQAAPLDVKQVAADAKGLVHVDVDAVRESEIVKKVWPHLMQMHPQAAEHLDKVSAAIGMDPRKDLHGVTAYGKTLGSHKGVLIVHAAVDQKVLLEKAEKAPDHKVEKYGAYDIHTWTAKHHGKSHTAAGAFYKADRVILASGVDELKAALDVLDGKAPSLAADSPLAAAVRPGTHVVARAIDIAAANLPCKSPLAKQVESAGMVKGEYQGQSFFDANVVTTNADTANSLKAIVDGVKALGTLHVQKDEIGKKLVDALKVEADGKTLKITWAGSTDDVWAMIQKHGKAIMERRAKMKEHWMKAHKDHEKK